MHRLGAGLAFRGVAAQAHHRVDLRLPDLHALLQAGVERLEGVLRGLDRIRRPGDRQAVAAGRDGDPELRLEARQVLVVLAEELGQQLVVVELEGQRFGVLRPAQDATSMTPAAGKAASSKPGPESRPARLLGWAPSIRTGRIRPFRRAGAAT